MLSTAPSRRGSDIRMEKKPTVFVRSVSDALSSGVRRTASNIASTAHRRKRVLVAVVIALHILLWSSAAAIGIAVYLLIQAPSLDKVIPTIVLMLAASALSLSYIALHTLIAKRWKAQLRQVEDASDHDALPYLATRLSVAVSIMWLLTSGWNLIMALRQSECPARPSDEKIWGSQAACVAHRFGTAISLLAFVDSISLFAILAQVRRPFEATLLGLGQVHEDPFFTSGPAGGSSASSRPSIKSPHTFTSTICGDHRCSTRPAPYTMFAVHSASNSRLHLPLTQSETAVVGLGIYAPPTRTPPTNASAASLWSRPRRASAAAASSVASTYLEEHQHRQQQQPRTPSPGGSGGSGASMSAVSCFSSLPPPQYPSSLQLPLRLPDPASAKRRNSRASSTMVMPAR